MAILALLNHGLVPFTKQFRPSSFLGSEAAHGVIAVFSVRLGTAFKWSPWSEAGGLMGKTRWAGDLKRWFFSQVEENVS